jgi:GTP-binding protein HflX
MLIHVIDASNSRWRQQIASVDRILAELKVDQIPRQLVFNKVDLVDQSEVAAIVRQTSIESGSEAIAISATHSKSLEPLLNRIDEILSRRTFTGQMPG